jgi:hypothetical protein
VTVYILAAFDPKRKDVATDSMSRIDVKRALINPIAASRGFTPKLLKYLLFQPCAYRRFTSYIAR